MNAKSKIYAMVDRCRAALLGAMLGDALGVPYEFKHSANIPPAKQIQMSMPHDFKKTYPAIPFGTWSDDFSQMLCLLDSLWINSGTLDLQHFADELLSWRFHGKHQAGGVVFDCGLSTNAALQRLQQGVLPEICGDNGVRSNGNGALMRVLPAAFLPFIWQKTPGDAMKVAINQGLITHRHCISKACCLLYVAIAFELFSRPEAGISELVNDAFSKVIAWLNDDDEMIAAVTEIRRFGQEALPTGGGYVVDTLWSALWALDHGSNFVDSLQLAVSLGNDTDTTACVTGGLAGLRYGLGQVPQSWWKAINDMHLVPRFPP